MIEVTPLFDRSATIGRPKLSILICSLSSRAPMLLRLMDALARQPGIERCEVLVAMDEGQSITGAKRNRLMEQAQGEYIVHIDDDDMVAERYVAAVLLAVDTHPNVDAVPLRGCRTIVNGGPPVVFDYKIGVDEGHTWNEVLWRSPGHLCPIRADIAKSRKFPLLVDGEDLRWARDIAPLLKTEERAGEPDEILYHYLYDPRKVLPTRDNKDHEDVFTPQYAVKSGPGSTRFFAAPYVRFVEQFIKDHDVMSILDLGCGDLAFTAHLKMHGAVYTGVDVIRSRVDRNAALRPGWKFVHADLRDVRPDADLVLIKDVIQHWSSQDIADWLRAIADAPFKYMLVTNCQYGPTVNTHCPTGGWRAIDLTKPPFSVGEIVFRWGKPNKDVVLLQGRCAR